MEELAVQCQRLSSDLRYQLAVRLEYAQVVDVDESWEFRSLFPNLLSSSPAGSFHPHLFWSEKCQHDFGVPREEYEAPSEITRPWQRYLYFAHKYGFMYPGYDHGSELYLKVVSQAIKSKRYNWVKYWLRRWPSGQPAWLDQEQIAKLLAKAILTNESKMVGLLWAHWQQTLGRSTLPISVWQRLLPYATRVGNQEWLSAYEAQRKLTLPDLVDSLVVTGAVRAGRIEELEQFKRVYPEKRNAVRWLAMACRSGNLQLVRRLLPTKEGKRQMKSAKALHAAIRSGNQELIKVIYARTIPDSIDTTILTKIARKGQFQLLDWLLEYEHQGEPENVCNLYLALIRTGRARAAVRYMERRYGGVLERRTGDEFFEALLAAGLEGRDREAIELALDCLSR